ncbi:uncharacterized protein LOC123546396 [Mercenaria mercenaria]|uniref:uncharacterized protein LOC123546396 n=1 Tax=Mercenaria mercenaria TaxID=6596 RepID=UPI00234E6455|nr:uncharacterized protein LOC123546396 [Mercenaria mercenaria]XP_053406713.1 uncharacterized protein LOC123546396 [Mercenaria mercenaria]
MAGIRVTYLPTRCTERDIKIHFTKPENGGGPVKEIYYPLFKGNAVVVFEDSVTGETVMAHEHNMMGETIFIEPLHCPQVFTTMEAKLEPSVAALIQATDEVRDDLQHYRDVEFCFDETGCITGVRGNWYLLEWIWAYIERLVRHQNDPRRYNYRTLLRDPALNEPRSPSPMQLDDHPIISTPSANDIKAEMKHKSTGVWKKETDSATAEVKMQTQKQTARTRKSVQIERDCSTDKEESLDYDKSLKRLTALTISVPEENRNEIAIVSDRPDDVRSIDFRYGPLTVSVYTGWITMAETDAIVNAANESLAHVGGIADAIAKAAGSEMQLQCEEYIRRFVRVPTTNVMHTCAGGKISLNVKYVMHAVGPIYSSTRPARCALELTQTFLNCLKYGNDILKIQSVAMPVISSGIFGCPLEVCVRSFFNAVLLFACEHMSDFVHLKEVHLVNNSSDQTALTVIQLRDLISQGAQMMVLEAKQQMQEKEVEDAGYKLQNVSGQRLDLDREPPTTKYRYDLASSPGERNYGFSLTTDNASRLHEKGNKTLLDKMSPSTDRAYGSSFMANNPSRQVGASNASSDGHSSIVDHCVGTVSPDKRETRRDTFSRSSKQGPPTTSYAYSGESGLPSGTSVASRTAWRPLPPTPPESYRTRRK